MDEIDKLLSQIKADDREPKMPKEQKEILAPLQSSSNIDNLLAEIKDEFSDLSTISTSLNNNLSTIDNVLSQVRANYDKKDQAQLNLEQQQLQTEQLQQIEELKIRAKAWLKQLDPLCTEGLWFERFAEGYPTKIEAAINYLQKS